MSRPSLDEMLKNGPFHAGGSIEDFMDAVIEYHEEAGSWRAALEWIAGPEGFGVVPERVLAREMQQRARDALAKATGHRSQS